MTASFVVLGSGSTGNAAFFRCGNFGLLIDLGLGPRTLARRFAQAGLTWNDIDAVILTHTHGDHWRETSMVQLQARGKPLYCHDSHTEGLDASSRAFGEMRRSGLVRSYIPDDTFCPGGDLLIRPLELKHDSHRTFGFRIEHRTGEWAAAYVADLGCYSEALTDALLDLDLLALEFNHDEQMQRASGRPAFLIERILGSHGHLSNCQAAELLSDVLGRSRQRRPQAVVALHLSQQCNRPEQALAAAQGACRRGHHPAKVVIARHDLPSPTLELTQEWAADSLFHGLHDG